MSLYNVIMIVLISLIFFVFIIWAVVDIVIKLEKNDIDESQSQEIDILMQDDSVDKINNILDTHIKNAGNNYISLTLNYSDELYITEAIEHEMSTYIFQSVKKNITPALIKTLSLIYIINSEDQLDELLKFRIKLYLITEIVRLNQDTD